ncbi:alginate export family protein [Paraflavisolibacter sp. H34]|uniref:alginate export family protein n=1 Tax=Huijunlia imazamoxiresistens TaxID=3127457 RepID=UPI00301A6975
MMKRIFFALLLGLPFTVGAQEPLPPFQPLRYNEDYSGLKGDTSSWYRKLKYTPLSRRGEAYASFGGEVRYQYFHLRHEDWGAAPRDPDGYTLARFLGQADLHAGSSFRLFVQLQGGLANGKASGTSAVDENPLDLHQAFVDIGNPSSPAHLRLGRQELSYGSQRLVSVRELPNNRQSFDAAKALFAFGGYRLDAFWGNYVTARKGIFDDRSGRDSRLWGAYLVKKDVPFLKNLDLYYLGLHKQQAVFDEGPGKERRHSAGSRVWGGGGGWAYDFEGVYQWGRFAGSPVRAWTLSSNTTYQFEKARLRPELGLKTEAISGDRGKGDGALGTFNPLFPKGAYFGLAALIGPANLFDIHPSLALELVGEKLVWSLDHDLFWRFSTADGIYGPNGALLFGSGNSGERWIGHQLATDLTYAPNAFLRFRGEVTWFRAGPYLEAVSPGKDIRFLGLTAQLKF